jgi:hypothetical protein
MRSLHWLRLQRTRNYCLYLLIANATWRSRSRLIGQALQALATEPFPPLSDGMNIQYQLLRHVLILLA